MPKPRVAFITCEKRVEPDPDATLLLEAVRESGLHAEWLAWDGEHGPERFDLCVLRTCWNYYDDVEGFRAWIERATRTSRLENPRDVVLWNLHKRYLDELREADVPTIPTRWVARGEQADLDQLYGGAPPHDIVIKPSISASSFGTRRFPAEEVEAARAFAKELARERDIMLQPALSGFLEPGERCLMWIDGAFTHAVTKHPRYAGQEETISEASEVSASERAFGERLLGSLSAELLYARIDVILEGGELMLSELELIEPSLFLREHPPALERLVEGIARRARA